MAGGHRGSGTLRPSLEQGAAVLPRFQTAGRCLVLSSWEGVDELGKLPTHLGLLQALVQGLRRGHTVSLWGL